MVQCPGGLTTRTTQQHGEYRDGWLMRTDSREILRASGGGAKKKARAVKGNPQKTKNDGSCCHASFLFMERNQRKRAHGSVRCRHGWRVCMRAWGGEERALARCRGEGACAAENRVPMSSAIAQGAPFQGGVRGRLTANSFRSGGWARGEREQEINC